MTCDCSRFSGRERDLCEGRGRDGRKDPRPEAVEHFRRKHHNAELPVPVQKSRGLGDTIAKFTHATGIAQAVEAVTNGNCGCKKRQELLNDLVPYQ